MLVTILGTYEDGKVKLDELPPGVHYAKAIVTLLPSLDLDDVAAAMKLSASSFAEWENEYDSIYDKL
jgi:hypothetical protein